MPKACMVKEEKDWEAEHDFETLQRAAEIAQDKKRLDRAIKAGEKKHEASSKALERAKGLRRS